VADQNDVLDAATLEHLRSWIGSSETLHDTLSIAPLRAMVATLDRSDTDTASGALLPPLWHWLYFLPCCRASDIGSDGHPQRGGFLPPVPLARRMWAGGRLLWNDANPLRVGAAVRRTSRVESITHKSGRSGELVFVTVRHEISNAHGPCLTEDQDLVYRSAPRPGEPAPNPSRLDSVAAWHRDFVPDEVLLFRYSALTFNSHRIHYDQRYATEVERYPQLVVHGPLIATLLLELLRVQSPAARPLRFEFAVLRPSFAGRRMRVNGQPADDGASAALWAEDDEGWLTVRAAVEFAS